MRSRHSQLISFENLHAILLAGREPMFVTRGVTLYRMRTDRGATGATQVQTTSNLLQVMQVAITKY